MKDYNIVLVLDNIRSAENVGALFRTADAVGVSTLYLCGVTPAPLDRFGRVVSKIHKTALGAEKIIPWKSFETTSKAIASLKKAGYEIVALEQSERSIAYRAYHPTHSYALVVGNEVEGVSKKVVEKADVVIEIPMKGEKESLNVSVATGIALFQIQGI